MPVTIDPRRHDTVLLDATASHHVGLERQLRNAGVVVAELDGHATPVEVAGRLSARPDRCVVITADPNTVAAACTGGFALIVGLDPARDHSAWGHRGADAVVGDLAEVVVRVGDKRMSELPDVLHAMGLDDGLAASHPAVFFDFDGTLSDIVNDPAAAVLTEGAAAAVAALAAHCPVAVLSGRDLADVTARVGIPTLWYAGSHGFELTAPDGTHHQNDRAAEAIPVLESAAARLRDTLIDIPGVQVEHKRFAVAVHYRNAARDSVGTVVAAVRAEGRRTALRVTTGREVIELRPDIDWDKGKTLHWMLDRLHAAGAGPLIPIYVGDDITDEDAFDAVRAEGLPIVVRHQDDGDRATAALFALDSPAAVTEFTAHLADRVAAETA